MRRCGNEYTGPVTWMQGTRCVLPEGHESEFHQSDLAHHGRPWSWRTVDPKKPVELRNWSGEDGLWGLRGEVYGHERKPDGHRIRTSRIEKISGRLVITHTGTTYLLGEPDPEWALFVTDRDEPLAGIQ